MNNENEIEHETERQNEFSIRKVKFECDYYDDNIEEEERLDREYKFKIEKSTRDFTCRLEMDGKALEAYHDETFYENVPRPHITVWIQWFKSCYAKKRDVEYDDQQVIFDLNRLNQEYHRFHEKLRMRRVRDSIWK